MTMCAYFSTMIFIIILWTSICLQDAQAIRKPFEVVKMCPFNESEWKVRAAHMTCNGSESYHCLLTEGGVLLREQCTETSLFTSGFCPIFTNEGYLQWSACKDTACPASSYRSDQVYQYQICYRKADNPIEKNTGTGSNDSSSVNRVTVITVAILLVFIVVLVSVLMVCYVRNQYGFKDKVQQCITDIRTHSQQSIDTEGPKDAEKGDSTEQALPLIPQDVEKGIPPEQARPLIRQEPLYAKPDKDKTEKAIAENVEAQSTQVPLLKQDVKHVQENETNSEKPVNAKPRPEKTLTKKEKVTNSSNAGGIKEEGQKDKNDEPPEKKIKKLKELLKYLVCILKQELGVNDLKEKVVVHSKSINEHFSELLIKDLQSPKDINDYSKLDTSLVLTLLRNFCEGIKPPSRGWDYEPPDDETHVGADIERIRSMWNKYCDSDFVFEHLDDVYNRIKLKYGTVAVQGDDGIMKSSSKDEENTETIHGNDGVSKSPSKDGENTEGSELMKEKINTIKLNPDCTVEKGIVITENITTALRLLKSRNVVILKGVIGCGKTHALKAIQNHFKENGWETVWVESENLLGEISTKRPTILLCDNLFGQFGSCVFSQTDVEKTEKTLGAIEGAGGNIKVVIGIHTHVYDDVKKSLKLNFIDKKNITVDMDKLSEAESVLIFKEQLKQGHCSKMDSNCWFKTVGFQSVLDKLSKNQGHIGGPFLSLMYCNQHELFSDEAFSVNPVQTLIQYFQRMRQDSPTLYHCLVYLMCVQEHNLEGNLEECAGMISIDITKHILENISSLSGFTCIQGEDKKKSETLAHDMLTIVLFKSAAETRETFKPVAQKCKVDFIIQILRPANGTYSNLYCEFKGAASKNYEFRDCGKVLVSRLVRKYNVQEGQVHHPFKSEEIFKEKYKRYIAYEPKFDK